jgi:hypothetical protein
MGWKVTLDLSLNKDNGSTLRNAINTTMGEFKRKGIATQVIESDDIKDLATKLGTILSYLANPTVDTVKANADAKLDHLWLYIEKTDEEEISDIRFTVLDSPEPETDGKGTSANMVVSVETEN